jgi:hypothetical protein
MSTELIEKLKLTEDASLQAEQWKIMVPKSRTAKMTLESIQDYQKLVKLRLTEAESIMFQPGDPIVEFRLDPNNKLKLLEFHGWYCGMKGDLHVYLLKLSDSNIAKVEGIICDMCHLNHLQARRDRWNKLVNNPESILTKIG